MPVPILPRLACIVVAFGALASPARAAHPLISEDTGTQGPGRFELELGNSLTYADAGRAYELDPQLSYGASKTVDLILRPSYLVLTGGAIPENGTRRGFGMTAIDFKWRFAESGAWSVGTRAGLDLPTAASGLGFDSPGGHALLVATGIFDRGIFTANLAWTRLPAGAGPKPDLYRVSAGGYASVTDHLRLAGDLAYYSVEADNGTQWAAVAVVGAIYTIVKDLDVDVGWQPRLKQPAPSNVLLFGLTVRW